MQKKKLIILLSPSIMDLDLNRKGSDLRNPEEPVHSSWRMGLVGYEMSDPCHSFWNSHHYPPVWMASQELGPGLSVSVAHNHPASLPPTWTHCTSVMTW